MQIKKVSFEKESNYNILGDIYLQNENHYCFLDKYFLNFQKRVKLKGNDTESIKIHNVISQKKTTKPSKILDRSTF